MNIEEIKGFVNLMKDINSRGNLAEASKSVLPYLEWLIEQAEKVEKYEKALEEIADSFAFDDIFDEVTTKRFIAKQILGKFES